MSKKSCKVTVNASEVVENLYIRHWDTHHEVHIHTHTQTKIGESFSLSQKKVKECNGGASKNETSALNYQQRHLECRNNGES